MLQCVEEWCDVRSERIRARECVAVCCSVLQSVGVRCIALQRIAECVASVAVCCRVRCSVNLCSACERARDCVAVRCSVLQRIATWCSALQRITGRITRVCCSVLQCVAVCCSVLQCVAVCCSVLHLVLVVHEGARMLLELLSDLLRHVKPRLYICMYRCIYIC